MSLESTTGEPKGDVGFSEPNPQHNVVEAASEVKVEMERSIEVINMASDYGEIPNEEKKTTEVTQFDDPNDQIGVSDNALGGAGEDV